MSVLGRCYEKRLTSGEYFGDRILPILPYIILFGVFGIGFGLFLPHKNAPPREIRKNIEEVMTADGKLERTITNPEGYQYILKSCYDRLNDSDDRGVVCVYNLNLRNYCKLAEKE